MKLFALVTTGWMVNLGLSEASVLSDAYVVLQITA